MNWFDKMKLIVDGEFPVADEMRVLEECGNLVDEYSIEHSGSEEFEAFIPFVWLVTKARLDEVGPGRAIVNEVIRLKDEGKSVRDSLYGDKHIVIAILYLGEMADQWEYLETREIGNDDRGGWYITEAGQALLDSLNN